MTHPGNAHEAGWAPVSPCTERCAPPGTRSGSVRSVCRAVALVVVLAAAALTAPLLAVLSAPARAGWLRVATRAALGAAGVAIRVHGHRGSGTVFGAGGVLVVANHLSWIEALALCGVAPIRLVAKREVRGWPVVGWIANAAGALFIDRRGLRGLPAVVAEMGAALRAGDAVAVFPEGTTWCGVAAGPFRRAAFQAALDAGVPVRPVAVTLRRGGQIAQEAAFVGDQSLLSSVARVLQLSAVVCELTLLPTIPPNGDRALLATRAGAAIEIATGIRHPAWAHPNVQPAPTDLRTSSHRRCASPAASYPAGIR
jgi:1-acyl-sn-glycerol-3-phosphate acyltransferase